MKSIVKNAALVPLLICGSLAVVACGSGEDPNGTFNDGNGGVIKDGTNSNGNVVGDGSIDPNSLDKCAEATAGGQLSALHLVIAVDVSGSMCEYDPNDLGKKDCSRPTSKWQQALVALNGFFAATEAGSQVSVSVMPWSGKPNQNNQSAVCPDNFQVLATNQALPASASSLSSSLAQVQPDGFTPTAAAIRKANDLAKTVAGKSPAIILVTDGIPAGCNQGNTDSGIALAKAAASEVLASGVKTHVVGLGNALDRLKEIAVAGGTVNPVLVSNSNPAAVSTELKAALTNIKNQALSCALNVPSAPAGKTIDFRKVNLTYTSVSGAKSVVPYSQDCSNPKGWKYDVDPAKGVPTRVELCTASCDGVKQDPSGKMEFILGCLSATGPVK